MELECDFKKFTNIGIFGGTFDPIHYGHLSIANTVKVKFNLDKVIFIPNGLPYYKSGTSTPNHRYIMTLLATLDNPNFSVSKIEIDRDPPIYTIDTIKLIKSIIPDQTKLFFIMGMDSISQITTWKNPQDILKLCDFIVVTRPNYTISAEVKKFLQNFIERIHFLETPALDISSTYIKNCIKSGLPITYLLPKNVEEYILKFNLYNHSYLFEKYKDIIEKLKQNMNSKRFLHSVEVAKEAINLAKKYNSNTEDAFLAGILHDCAKCFSAEKKLDLCKKYSIELDDAILNQIDLSHSFLGYFIARDDYNIKDENILSAIKYHTTGNKNMSVLQKIIYIADYIEPTRPPFDTQAKARELAYKDLDLAMKFILQSVIDFNLSRNRIIHKLSIIALDFYERECIKNES